MRWIDHTSREMREHAVAAGAILAITVLFFLPVLCGRTFSMVGAHMFAQYPWAGVIKDSPEVRGRGYPQTDQAETFYPGSVFASNAVSSGQFPMWLPYSFSGVPIMQIDIGTGLLYPPKLLAMRLLSPTRQHDFILFTHLLLAGLGMYALLRCWNANALGAVFGAIVWEFNGHNAFWMTFEHVAITAAWFPIVMLGATLAIRKQSLLWSVATGVAFGMSVLNSTHDCEYLGAFVLAAWYAGLTIRAGYKLRLAGDRRATLRCLSLPLISLVVAAGLSAALWLPLVGLLSHVHRQPSTLIYQRRMAIPFSSLFRGLIFPLSSAGPAGKGPDYASFAFVGIPALIFVLAGFFRRSVSTILVVVLGSVSVGILLGFRPLLIIFRLVLPYFGVLPLHSGAYFLCFSVAVLAAFGITEVNRRFIKPDALRRTLLVVGCLLVALESVHLILFAWIINPLQPARPEWLFPETPLISKLKATQDEFHVLPISLRLPSGEWTPPVFAGKVGAVFNLRSGSGYESLLPLWTANLWRTVEQGGKIAEDIPASYRPYFYHDRLPMGLLEKLSVGLIATPPNTKPRDADGSDPVADGSLQLVYQGPDGWIYKLHHALPRAFLVPKVLTAPDPSSALGILVDRNFDARQAVIVIGEKAAAETGLPSPKTSGVELLASANIVSDRINDVEVEVNSSRAAMLVLNDSWDGGWKAHLDGVEQPVLRVNYAFRGVVVPEGNHRVVFLYRPPLLLLGLSFSGATMLLLVIVGAWVAIGSRRRFR